jgi:hypothetical protein
VGVQFGWTNTCKVLWKNFWKTATWKIKKEIKGECKGVIFRDIVWWMVQADSGG